jgi:hypothetical protein
MTPHSPALLAASQLTVAEAMKRLGVQSLNLDSFLTIGQAAQILGVHPDTIRRNYSGIFSRLSPGRIGIKVRTLFEEVARRSAA